MKDLRDEPASAEASSDSSGEAALIQNRLHNLDEIRRVVDAYPFRFDIRETISEIAQTADRLRASIPAEHFDFDAAKADVMARTML